MSTYYVSTSGSDGAAGSIGAPWLTIGHAVAQLVAGDTLWIRGGVYTGTANQINDGLTSIASGSLGSPILIGAYGGTATAFGSYGPSPTAEVVIIQVPNPQNGIQLTGGQTYLTIQDLIIDMSLGTLDQSQAGIYLNGGSSHNTFHRNEVHHSINFGIATSDHNGDAAFNTFRQNDVHDNGDPSGLATNGHGFYLETTGNLCEHNRVTNNVGCGVQFNTGGAIYPGNVIRKNVVRGGGRPGQTSFGITVERCAGFLIADNLVSDRTIGSGCGIMAYSLSVSTLIAHNTIDNVSGDGLVAQFIDASGGPGTYPTFQNNIVRNVGGTPIINYGDATTGSQTTWVVDHNLLTDPSFVNAGLDDFHLSAGSAASGAGVYLAAVPDDFDGLTRPNPPAIGAFESPGGLFGSIGTIVGTATLHGVGQNAVAVGRITGTATLHGVGVNTHGVGTIVARAIVDGRSLTSPMSPTIVRQGGVVAYTTYRKALAELADLPTYFGGRKTAGLSAIGALDHGLGTDTATFAASAADITFVDSQTDRTWRDLLSTTDLEGDEARIYAASQHARDNNLAPRLLFRGSTQLPTLSSPLQAKLSILDSLFALGGPFGPQRLWPPLIPAIAAWSNTPPAVLTKGLPWLYGEKSDHDQLDPATNLPSLKGSCPLIYVGQEAITATGVVPPYTYDPTIRPPKNAATVTISGTTWGTTVGYRHYAVASIFGTRVSLPIMFDNTLRFPGQVPTSGPPYNERVVWDLWPGTPIPDAFLVFEFDPSNWNPFTNPYVAANPRYKVVAPVVTNPAGPPDVPGGVDVNASEPWAYSVDWTSVTDGTPWASAGTPVTTTQLWDAYLAFGHPAYLIESIFGSDLGNGIPTATHQRTLLNPDARADLLVPGFAAWPFATKYREYVGPGGITYWLTMIYARGPLSDDAKAGTVGMAVNAIGREDVGDGTGLPIVGAHDVEQAWLENEILSYWTAGPLANATTYPQWADGTPKVRSSRFAARQAHTLAALGPPGLQAHWYEDTPGPVETHCQAWDTETETQLGQNGFGQVTLGWIDEAADPTNWPQVDHVVDLFGQVTTAFGVNRGNQGTIQGDWDPDSQTFRTPVIPLSSPAGFKAYKNRWIGGPLIQSKILGTTRELAWVLAKRLLRLQFGETQVTVPGTIRLFDYDVDDPGILLSTFEGPGSSGYVQRPMWLRRRSFDLKTYLVTYSLIDVASILYATQFPAGIGQVPTSLNTSGVPVTDDPTLAPVAVL